MVAGGSLLVFLALASPALAQVPTTSTAVPEIDPSTAVSGITLLAGGMLLLADKFRMRK
jgi:hypothetical protein